jgi:hypothetical protein
MSNDFDTRLVVLAYMFFIAFCANVIYVAIGM